MLGSNTRYLAELSRYWAESARNDGARAARAGEPREVPALYLDRAATWLFGYDANKQEEA